jgi:hypothetical protein
MAQAMTEELERIPMSPALQTALLHARDYAHAQTHAQITLEHLLLALTEDEDAAMVMQTCRVDLNRLRNDVAAHLGNTSERSPAGPNSEPGISPGLTQILKYATLAAQQGRRPRIDGAIVLAALVGDGRSMAATLLTSQGLTFDQAIRVLQQGAVRATPAAPSVNPNADVMPHDERGPAQHRHEAPSSHSYNSGAPPAPELASSASTEDILTAARERIEARSASSRKGASSAAGSPRPAPPPAQRRAASTSHLPPPADPYSGQQGSSLPSDVAPDQPNNPPPPSVMPPQTAASIEAAAARLNRQPGDRNDGPLPLGGSDTARAGATPRDAGAPRPGPPQAPPAVSPPLPRMPTRRPYAGQPPPLPPPAAGPAPADEPQNSWSPPRLPDAAFNGAIAGRPAVMPGSPLPPTARPALPPVPQAPVPERAPRPPASDIAPWPEWADKHPPSETAASGYPAVTRSSESPPGLPSYDQASSNDGAGRSIARTPSRRGPAIEPSQLAHSIPTRMKRGRPVLVEVRIERPPLPGSMTTPNSRPSSLRSETVVARAISVRLRSAKGLFAIDALSPETQWDQAAAGGGGRMNSDAAVWRFSILPNDAGSNQLLLTASARTIGADAVIVETALPDQPVAVRVRSNWRPFFQQSALFVLIVFGCIAALEAMRSFLKIDLLKFVSGLMGLG